MKQPMLGCSRQRPIPLGEALLLVAVAFSASGGCAKPDKSNSTGDAAMTSELQSRERTGEKDVSMRNEQVWNDESRDELRETLRSVILGEIRLAKRGRDAILDACREVYIQDVCPEHEWDKFIQFAADELRRATTLVASEKMTWPEVTDCDRLDRVEAALRDRGILLWQVSPCCDTCTGGELPDRIDVTNRRYPGFRDYLRGYAFFIDQNMPEMLAESTDISVYLAYGWFSPDDSEVAPEAYEKNALGIAREVCECLRDEGFEPDWNGDFARKIGVTLKWQRRTPLE